MKRTEEKVKMQVAYSEYLTGELDKYAIKVAMLAEKIGKSPKTVKRYAMGDCLPDKETRESISAEIKSLTTYGCFHALAHETFATLLQTLLAEFRYEMTQQELADRVGVTQKDISNYQYADKKIWIPAKLQYDILHVFLEMSTTEEGNILTAHEDVAWALNAYCQSDWSGMEPFDEIDEDEEAQYDGTEAALAWFETCTLGVQKIILDHIAAFCDNYVFDEMGYFPFEPFQMQMERFRLLLPVDRQTIVSALEDSLPSALRHLSYATMYFDKITAYREMIQLCREKRSCLAEESCDSPQSEVRRRIHLITFEKKCKALMVTFGDITEEIAYKLDFSAEEWYVWMLFVLSDLRDTEITELFHRASAVESG